MQINPLPGKPGKVDIVWLGSLTTSCKVPADAIGLQSGDMPGFSAGTSVSIDATLAASLASVSLGLGGNFEKSSTLTIRKASLDTINLINLDNWLQTPANRSSFEAACGPVLQQSNVFAVDEAFVIADGTYSIKNTAGAKVAFTPPPNIPVKASADASGGSSGDLTITQPVVFALRQMAPFTGSVFALAARPVPNTDAPTVALHASTRTPLAGKTVEEISFQAPRRR